MRTGPQTGSAPRRARPGLAEPGDWIEVEGTGGAGARRGVIVEVPGSGAHLHFLVRWNDEHDSLFYPAERGCIVHASVPQGAR